ncbi:MAG TPA: protein YgfX [Nevskiaceae bacterium]|nr:protein YgfX [Nevskiaceae bacterium]
MSSAVLDLRLRPSGRGQQLLFWVHALPLLLMMLSDAPPRLLLPTVLAVGLSWWWLRRHAVLGHGPRAIRQLQLDLEGQWRLGTLAVALGPQTRVDWPLPGTVWLVLEQEGRRHCRLLLGDELDEASYRRLRQRLRAPAAAGG